MSGLFLQRFGDRPHAVDLPNRGLLLLCSGASFSTGRTPETRLLARSPAVRLLASDQHDSEAASFRIIKTGKTGG
jgi:hypothetical protein